MILTVDIGNTNIVIGGFVDGEIGLMSRISTDIKKTEDEYAVIIKNIVALNHIKTTEVKGAIISSVVPPLNKVFVKAISKIYGINPMIVGPGVKTGVNLLVDNPAQVGADLVCSAIAAYTCHSAPAIIIDMGTATKLSVIDKNGAFLGVSIIPGVELGISALSGGTAQLPHIGLDAPRSVIGKNTVDAMQSGVVYGNACLIDGMIDRITEEYGDLPIIATGGIAGFIIPYCRHEITLDEHLILKGLYTIYNKNI